MWYGASGRVHVDELGVEGKQLIFSRTLRQELRVFFFFLLAGRRKFLTSELL